VLKEENEKRKVQTEKDRLNYASNIMASSNSLSFSLGSFCKWFNNFQFTCLLSEEDLKSIEKAVNGVNEAFLNLNRAIVEKYVTEEKMISFLVGNLNGMEGKGKEEDGKQGEFYI